MKLVLGVQNVAYSDAIAKGVTTTGEVAELLESEYDVMGVFMEIHGKEVMEAVGEQMGRYLQSILQGNPKEAKHGFPLGRVEEEFKDYLSADEWQSHTGAVIQAARIGRSARFKNKKFKNDEGVETSRPAFIDTGLYSASFRAWIEP